MNWMKFESKAKFIVEYLGIKRWIDPIREGEGMRESVWIRIRIRIRIVESSIVWAIDPELVVAIVVNFECDLAHFFFEICIRSPHLVFHKLCLCSYILWKIKKSEQKKSQLVMVMRARIWFCGSGKLLVSVDLISSHLIFWREWEFFFFFLRNEEIGNWFPSTNKNKINSPIYCKYLRKGHVTLRD